MARDETKQFLVMTAGMVVIALGIGVTVLSWGDKNGDFWVPTPWGRYGGSDLFDLAVVVVAVALMFLLFAIWGRIVIAMTSTK